MTQQQIEQCTWAILAGAMAMSALLISGCAAPPIGETVAAPSKGPATDVIVYVKRVT